MILLSHLLNRKIFFRTEEKYANISEIIEKRAIALHTLIQNFLRINHQSQRIQVSPILTVLYPAFD